MKAHAGVLLTLALLLCGSALWTGSASSQPVLAEIDPPSAEHATGHNPLSTATFSLDGVDLQIITSFLPYLEFAASDPNTAIQTATAVVRAPLFKEFTITAIPFGVRAPTEALPRAGPHSEEAIRSALREYRETQGADPTRGPAIRLFGRYVAGLSSEADLVVRGRSPAHVTITEWVAEAGDRIWIVRASQELGPNAASRMYSGDSSNEFLSTSLSSPHVNRPSTSRAATERGLSPTDGNTQGVMSTGAASSKLPDPSWWNGECDAENYRRSTGWDAYPLGAEYRGMKACGPRPWADYAPVAIVDFGAGVSQLEWQCPELSKRFLYLAYDIAPYLANGSQVVWHYSGDLLEKVSNCETGRAPEPDDVLSYGSTSTYGHTSVVVSSEVDGEGNGTIDVIEQNNSATGFNTLDVVNWCVAPAYGEVSGWLHRPDRNGWAAEYYSDAQLTTKCQESYLEGTYIFGDWADRSPAESCPADYFSARFSRSVIFAGGTYTFGLGYDGGARLALDGETVIDSWEKHDQAYRTRFVPSGRHEVEVVYRADTGDAYLSALWWGPGFDLARESQNGSEWYAQYWGNQALWWDPVVKVNEGAGFLDHDWDYQGPADALPADNFSSRFKRKEHFDGGRWRFVLAADDGVRLWMDNELIIDEWQDQVSTFKQEMDLAEGDHTLKLEHYENLGAAAVRLSWERVPVTTTLSGGITSPVGSTNVISCPLTIEADVRDEGSDEAGGVGTVAFLAAYDETWHHLGDDSTWPYRWTWDCSSVGNQAVWLAIHVLNSTGNEVIDLGGHVYVRLDVPRHLYLPLLMAGQ